MMKWAGRDQAHRRQQLPEPRRGRRGRAGSARRAACNLRRPQIGGRSFRSLACRRRV